MKKVTGWRRPVAAVVVALMVINVLFSIQISLDSQRVDNGIVYLGEDGQLVYVPHANEGEQDRDNIIPDFSHAGYAGGGVPVPNVSTVMVLGPVAGDNRARIQDAINALAAQPEGETGFRGAIMLEAGRYEVNGTLFINARGIVLRGEGQGTGGTVLVATARHKHDFIRVHGTGTGFAAWGGEGVPPWS